MLKATNTAAAAPSIWNFVEPLEFLKSHYEYRKAQESNFSYALWAAEMQIKSRSYLRLVMIGKRTLNQDLAQTLAQNLDLNKSETLFFQHLVGLKKATQLQAQEYHSREIALLRKKFLLRNHKMEEVDKKDLFDFLSSYKIPRLQVLLTLDEVTKTVPELAKLLKTKDSDVAQYLKTLQNLGLAQEDENKIWKATRNQIGAPDALGNVALQSFHRKSLEEAIQCLTLPKETRRFQSLVITLTQKQMEDLHQHMRQTLDSYLDLIKDQDVQTDPRKVYQLNLNLIPVTESIDRASEEAETVESDLLNKENV